jgi:hypothetical protein
MTSPSTVPTIRSGQGIVFGSHKMLTSGTTMSTFAEYPDLIYEVAFFHFFLIGWQR